MGREPGTRGHAADADHPIDVTHICKHCPATGSECEECGGDGRGEWTGTDAEGHDEFDNCEICHGEGVIAGATVDQDD
jgi:hypothetical protein